VLGEAWRGGRADTLLTGKHWEWAVPTARSWCASSSAPKGLRGGAPLWRLRRRPHAAGRGRAAGARSTDRPCWPRARALLTADVHPVAWTGLSSLEALPDDAVLEMRHAVGLAEPGLLQLHSLRELVEQPTATAEQDIDQVDPMLHQRSACWRVVEGRASCWLARPGEGTPRCPLPEPGHSAGPKRPPGGGQRFLVGRTQT
jgi:hypothetical protein